LATELQVRDMQTAILRAYERPQGGDMSATVLLSQLFDEIFASLVGPNSSLNFHAAIDDAETELEEWRRALIRHTYYKLVGPHLQQHQAVLNHSTDHVLNFWDATQEMCHWLAGLLWEHSGGGDEELSEAERTRTENEFVWEIREPGWSDAVQLISDADAIWQIPGTKHWCVVKLGQTDYDYDILYASLYHHLLLAAGKQPDGKLSLVTFGPQRRERMFSAFELASTEKEIKSLIGKLAGVFPGQMVLFSDIRPLLPKPDPFFGCSRAPLGIDSAGQLRLIDFAQPEDAHLLVVGVSGSGKSEWLRSAIAGLIVTNSPGTLRLLLIDPAGSAFASLHNSPFLLGPIINPAERSVTRILSKLNEEMERRYQMLSESGQDSLAEYIQRKKRQIPRIFCVCDEYASLISGDIKKRKTIERQIVKLGQRARAVGIHLVIATQYPDREIIKGVLDSSIPARIGMKMQKPTESKLLLDYAGAENLAGNGDLLFKDVGEPVRLQGVYLPEDEAIEIFGGGAERGA
jgi:energy-coupling factor transporter ATP-binding protein EcfA2